jgi:hypothetical protein
VLTLGERQLCSVEFRERIAPSHARTVLEIPACPTFGRGERGERVEPTMPGGQSSNATDSMNANQDSPGVEEIQHRSVRRIRRVGNPHHPPFHRRCRQRTVRGPYRRFRRGNHSRGGWSWRGNVVISIVEIIVRDLAPQSAGTHRHGTKVLFDRCNVQDFVEGGFVGKH